MSKYALYEQIMRQASREVKRAINEEYGYDYDEIDEDWKTAVMGGAVAAGSVLAGAAPLASSKQSDSEMLKNYNQVVASVDDAIDDYEAAMNGDETISYEDALAQLKQAQQDAKEMQKEVLRDTNISNYAKNGMNRQLQAKISHINNAFD